MAARHATPAVLGSGEHLERRGLSPVGDGVEQDASIAWTIAKPVQIRYVCEERSTLLHRSAHVPAWCRSGGALTRHALDPLCRKKPLPP